MFSLPEDIDVKLAMQHQADWGPFCERKSSKMRPQFIWSAMGLLSGCAPRNEGHAKPSNLTALPFKIPGMTSGLKPATSKSFIQRSGVMRG